MENGVPKLNIARWTSSAWSLLLAINILVAMCDQNIPAKSPLRRVPRLLSGVFRSGVFVDAASP